MKYRLATLFVVVALAAGTVAAQDAKSSSNIQRINPPTLNKPNGYTHVVIAKGSRMIFIAGQTSTDKDGNIVGKGDFRAQATRVFENLKLALATAGASFNDVVKVGVYLRDMADREAINTVRRRYFGDARPASTLVQVSALAHPDALVEIEAIALLPRRNGDDA